MCGGRWRTRRTGAGSGSPAAAYPDASDLADGTYAWEVYAQDSWGAKSATAGPCRFTVDRTDPNAPAVVFPTYPAGAEGAGLAWRASSPSPPTVPPTS
ncbi:hypothetical protein [Amycolatopsis nalaikhensis]|uniref:Uncharacterized protein n=1 Tax=Amycolatopsis nalaikhensis TaxID=715472 RepID=A0ABY8XEH4_9PSEU|nr:hypothetical protein [Amycolatopsis sp. 2-2]WIV54022.1 hypothetical protein QP939_34845 [Amycolatopsis sp. 2-2]